MTITEEARELMEQIDRDRLPIRVKFGALIRGRFRWFAAAGNKHAEIPKVHNHRRLSYDERVELARFKARGLRECPGHEGRVRHGGGDLPGAEAHRARLVAPTSSQQPQQIKPASMLGSLVGRWLSYWLPRWTVAIVV